MPVLMLLLLISPSVANGQSLELYGAAGPTIIDTGNSLAVGAGFSPHSRITLVFNFERTHLASQTSWADGVFSSFRGGTMFLATGEVRFVPLGRNRLGPYGLAGVAAGLSRPNVNDIFRERVTHYAQAIFFGGGVHVPVGERTTVFADVRIMAGVEGREGMIAAAPVRAGIAWRF
jgi:hypothetical protein